MPTPINPPLGVKHSESPQLAELAGNELLLTIREKVSEPGVFENVNVPARILNRATNSIPGAPKSALYLTRADAVAAGHPDDLALEDIPDNVIAIGGHGYVDLPATGQVHHYVARYYGGPNPTRFCFLDGDGVVRPDHFQQYGGLAPYAWFPVDSAAAGVPAYDSLPDGYAFQVDELVRAYVPGVSTEQFFKARTSGPLPAPSAAGGDANWEAVDEQDVPTGGGVSRFVDLTDSPYDNEQLGDVLRDIYIRGNNVGQRVTTLENNSLPTVVASDYNGQQTYMGNDAAIAARSTGIFGDIFIFRSPQFTFSRGLQTGTYLHAQGVIFDLRGFTLSLGNGSIIYDMVAQNGALSADPPGYGGLPPILIGGLSAGIAHTCPPSQTLTLENRRVSRKASGYTYAGGGMFILRGTTPEPAAGDVEPGTTVVYLGSKTSYIQTLLFTVPAGVSGDFTITEGKDQAGNTVSVSDATWFGFVGVRANDGDLEPLDWQTGYSFVAGQLKILALANVQPGQVINFTAAKGGVAGTGGGADLTNYYQKSEADAITEAIRASVRITPPVNASRNLLLTDSGCIVRVEAAATLTIPKDTFISDGTKSVIIEVVAYGAFVVTIAAASGVVIKQSKVATDGTDGYRLVITQRDTNTFDVNGGV